MNKTSIIFALASAPISALDADKTSITPAPAPFEIQRPDFKTYTFEDGVPPEFSAGEGSALDIDTGIFKTGSRSLRWSWSRPGASITYRCAEAFSHLTGKNPDPIIHEWVTCVTLSALSFWIYNDNADGGALRMEIGEGDEGGCVFPLKLNFKGWRKFTVMYGRDLPVFPPEGSDTLRFTAPEGRSSGVIRIDNFAPRTEMNVRGQGSLAGSPVKYLQSGKCRKGNPPPRFKPADPGILSEKTLACLSKLTADVMAPYLPAQNQPDGTVSGQEMIALRETHGKRRFVRTGENISGDTGGMDGFAYAVIAGDKTYWSEARQLADAWLRSSGQPKERAELESMFMDYADLCVQHGAGSPFAVRDHFARPVLWMREPLARRGKFTPLVSRLRAMINMDAQIYSAEEESDTSYYDCQAPGFLFLIFIQDDPAAKHRDLQALRQWLEHGAERGAIRPDGSFFHHSQTYSGYNIPAIPGLARVNCLLAKTEFAAPLSRAMTRRVALAMNFYSCNGGIPHILSGRWRGAVDFTSAAAEIFWRLAEAGNPETGESFDREMASIHLYYAVLGGRDDKHAAKYRKMGIEPWRPSGHMSLNYTVAAVHRRDDWMVFFRGQRNPFFSSEAYSFQAGNTMGRYLTYGHMAVISAGSPPSEKESGFHNDGGTSLRPGGWHGWNFNFWPGTTAREIPPDALRSHFNVEEQLPSETFAAGTSLDGNGVFGMRLKEELPGAVDPTRIGPVRYWLGDAEYSRRVKDSMYDTSFRALKSVFFFDNRILCLGSGICSDDREHPVKTTLFQRMLSADDRIMLPFPEKCVLGAGRAAWLADRNGDGYYLAPDNDTLLFSRAHRSHPFHACWCPDNEKLHNEITANEGYTELAVLDHGKNPRDKGYEYCAVIRAGDDAMRDFAEKMSDPKTAYYRVIQKDSGAHIVYDRPNSVFAYVIFEGGRPLKASGPLLSAGKPCLVMIKETEAGLKVSVCDPEITGDAFGAAGQTTVTLILREEWKAPAASDGGVKTVCDDESTLVTVTCSELRPVVFNLERAKDRKTKHGAAKPQPNE